MNTQEKKKKQLAAPKKAKKPWRKRLACLLARFANMLLLDKECCVVVQKKVDDDDDDVAIAFNDAYIHTQIQMWSNNSCATLYDLTHKYRSKTQIASIFYDDPSETILPKREDIQSMLDDVIMEYASFIAACEDKQALRNIIQFDLQKEFSRIYKAVTARIAELTDCENKVKNSILFLSEVCSAETEFRRWRSFTGIVNAHDVSLFTITRQIQAAWEIYEGCKSRKNLFAFYAAIPSFRQSINTVINAILRLDDSEKIDYRDLRVLVLGASLAYQPQPLVEVA